MLDGDHPGLVAAIEEHRDRSFAQGADRRARLVGLRVGGDLQNLGQAGIFVAAECGVEQVIGHYRRIVRVVADSRQRAYGKFAGFLDAQVDAIRNNAGHGRRSAESGNGILPCCSRRRATSSSTVTGSVSSSAE